MYRNILQRIQSSAVNFIGKQRQFNGHATFARRSHVAIATIVNFREKNRWKFHASSAVQMENMIFLCEIQTKIYEIPLKLWKFLWKFFSENFWKFLWKNPLPRQWRVLFLDEIGCVRAAVRLNLNTRSALSEKKKIHFIWKIRWKFETSAKKPLEVNRWKRRRGRRAVKRGRKQRGLTGGRAAKNQTQDYWFFVANGEQKLLPAFCVSFLAYY